MATTIKITDVGLAEITAVLAAGDDKYVGWGTGTNAAATGDTTLQTPGAESRTSGTQTQQTTTATNDTYQVAAAITCAGSAKDITEVGIFDASTDGNLYLRAAFDTSHVEVGDSITFTIKTVFVSG